MVKKFRQLKNKPLVEAILEVRWALRGQDPGPQRDPHYKLLLGRLFDRMLSEYPEHEQLSTANVPDELVGHVVQHRFRVATNKWPLIQVGPGIFTVNSTSDYTWSNFRPRVLSAVNKLFDAHPNVNDLKVIDLILRYIDAVDFDYLKDDAFNYIDEKLKLKISLHPNLFENTDVDTKPTSFIWQSSFKCKKPKGMINIRFATGRKGGTPAIIWETTVESVGGDVPTMPDKLEDWIDAAYDITHDWFFKMIEGELERRFSGE